MNTNYQHIIEDQLGRLYANPKEGLEGALPAHREGEAYYFRSFGEACCLESNGITLSDTPETGPKGLLIALYATHVKHDPIQLEPFKAFKDLPDSMPYHGAFNMNSEQILVSRVTQIKERRDVILKAFDGESNPAGAAGDFSLLLYPLPKIALCYIFYLPDDEFPASATCLFSRNALSFLPLDGLADVGEYTSKKILQLI
jgi:hypothetical protein